jgi:pimeloyl-ACP methyl ester carboxylesterase
MLLSGCASNEQKGASRELPSERLQKQLVRTEREGSDAPQKLADYLRIAEVSSLLFSNDRPDQVTNDPALGVYNRAVADFIVSWSKQNRPAEVFDARSGERFRLISAPLAKGAWLPNYFQTLQGVRTVNRNGFSRFVERSGPGGTLIGIRHSAPEGSAPPRLEPPRGFRMAVTGVLRFRRSDSEKVTVTDLELLNPRVKNSVLIEGRPYPLAADFTAPLASYPRVNELWAGIVNMVLGARTEDRSGLYLLEPYDADRIPVVLVHGLLSSGYTWLNTGNAIQSDSEIRKRYQFWVFFYPTGNPILYSASRLREDLAVAHQRYGLRHGIILVGHSMGGIISRLQVTELDSATYTGVYGKRANILLSILASDARLKSAFIFKANPLVKRVIFISTPHRGSAIASGGLGALGDRIIRLPSLLVRSVPKALLKAAKLNANRARIPTSIDGLSPKSPLLRMMDRLPIRAPHNSIIGDRGKGNTPNSSDGVVPYWSSHLATASSELIVPTGHGLLNSPLVIAEIQRILRLGCIENKPLDRR